MPDDAPFLLDVTRLVWRRWRGRLPTGIDRVCLAYLRHFGPRSQAVVQHERFRRILGPQASQDLFALLGSTSDHFRTRLVSGAFRHVAGMKSDGDNRLYLNVGHTGLNSPGFRGWVSASEVRPVYFVHDLIPITHPQFCRAGEDEKHRERIRTVLTTAAGVIGNSQSTLDELAAFAAAERLAMPKTHVAPLGIDPLPSAVPKNSPVPTFITLGTIEARKNHLLLLNVWKRLIGRFGNDAPRLVIIGQRGWEAAKVFELLDRDQTLRPYVTELSHCSDEELATHLATARALLFPSFAEGFGLPLAEALAAGVPVIASDLPAFRELSGTIPTYLSPFDETVWEEAVVEYARAHSADRTAQCRRLIGYHAPSWDDHFNSVDSWLATLG